MPQQWKRAEYKPGQKSKVEVPREEWYRVSEGFTHGGRVCLDGEIFHISELDTQDASGQNVESFRPLHVNEQERRFGRVYYMPYKPTDQELEDLGFEREDVRADPDETQSQLESLRGEDSSDTESEKSYKQQLAGMDKSALQAHARERWNMELVDEMPVNRMRAALAKMERDQEEGAK